MQKEEVLTVNIDIALYWTLYVRYAIINIYIFFRGQTITSRNNAQL